MLKYFYFLVLMSFFVFGCKNKQSNVKVDSKNTITYQERLSKLLNYPVDSLSFPRSATSDGLTKKVTSKDWTSGFFPGSLWYTYQLTNDEKYLEKAKDWTVLIEQEKNNNCTHDMGFKVFCSFGNGYKVIKDTIYKKIIIKSAQTLATRYNAKIQAIKSWDFGKDKWIFPVIIDNMMNLELLFEAAKYSKDSTYKYIAYQHAKTTLKNHFRPDNSTFHVVDYDTTSGNARNKLTHQGFADTSSWARGQAWAVYGCTMVYRYTKDVLFLSQAKKTANFFINHSNLPNDGIPYWDFNAPKIPNELRDASAAAIMASALIELNRYTKKDEYIDYANKVITSLSSPNYIIQNETDIPFILYHSTGNWPKNDEINGPINYADYYYLEALVRKKNKQF